MVQGLYDTDEEKEYIIYEGKKREQQFLKKMKRMFNKTIDLMTPLNSMYERIKLQHDKSTCSFFGIYRYLIQFSIISMIPFGALCLYHRVDKQDLCSIDNFPCFIFYSSFKSRKALSFSTVYFIFGLMGLFVGLSRSIHYQKENLRNKIYNDSSKMPVAVRFFNSWDWNNNDYSLRKDFTNSVFNDILFAMHIYEIELKINQRSFLEKVKLFLRRFSSGLLTIGVLVGGNILLIEIEDNYSPKLIK